MSYIKSLKYSLLVIMLFIFLGCSNAVNTTLSTAGNIAGSVVGSIIKIPSHSSNNTVNQSNQKAISDTSLTTLENDYERTLPKSYFNDSIWQGYYLNESKEFYQNISLKVKTNKTGILEVFNDTNKLLFTFDVIIQKTRRGLFVVSPSQHWHKKNKNKLFYSLTLFREDIYSNSLKGDVYIHNTLRTKAVKNGVYSFNRVDNYQLPKINQKPEDTFYTSMDLNKKNSYFSKRTNSKIFLEIDYKTHSSFITKIIAKNNNKDLITASAFDKSIRLWDSIKKINTQKFILQKNSKNQEGIISTIALHPNQEIIAIAGVLSGETLGDNNSIIIYNTKNNKIQNFLKGHKATPTNFNFSDDGKYLFSVGQDFLINIWDLENYKLIKSISFKSEEKFEGGEFLPKVDVIKKNNDYNILVSYNRHLDIYSMNSEKRIHSYIHHKNIVSMTHNDNQIAITDAFYRFFILNTNLHTVKPILLSNKSGVFALKYSIDGRKLAVASRDKIYLYDVDKNYSLINKSMSSKNNITAFDFKNNNEIYFVDVLNKISILNLNNFKIVNQFGEDKKVITSNVGVTNSSLFWTPYYEKTTYNSFDFNTRKLTNEKFSAKNIPKNYQKYSLSKTSDQRTLIITEKKLFGTSQTTITTGGKYHTVHMDFGFYKNFIISSGTEYISIYTLSGDLIASLSLNGAPAGNLSIYKNTLISSGIDGVIKIWDLSKIHLLKTQFDNPSTLPKNTISSFQKAYPKIDLSKENGISLLYKMLREKNDPMSYHFIKPNHINPKVNFYTSTDNEWVMWTPEGYFDSSENGYKYIGYHINQGYQKEANWVGVEKLYDHFFRPDLVKLKLQGKDISQFTNGLTYEDVLQNPAPSIRIKSVNKNIPKQINNQLLPIETKKNKAKVSFSVADNQGGIGLIRIYQEGKLVKTIGEGKVKRAIANAVEKLNQDELDKKSKKAQTIYLAELENSMTKSISSKLDTSELLEKVQPTDIENRAGEFTIDLPLKAGKNTIAIEAFNKTNTVASYRESITIDAKIRKREPKIYALVIGVNKFEQSNVSELKYSENDAKTIAEKIKNATKNKTEVHLIKGDDVTKENIEDAIEKIKGKAHLEDKIVFYISTHGKAVRGNLYLVPHNNKVVKNWINFETIFKDIQSIKALDQIFIIDACESGKASDIMSSIYDAKASVLAKQSGVHVLMATTKGTFAFEHADKNVKHGVFTYNILKALENKITDTNHDGWISVIELSKQLQKPVNSAQHQFPIIRNVGQDTNIKKVK